MLKVKLYNLLISSAALLFLTQCKNTKELEGKNLKKMPISFVSITDSTNSASLTWKQSFFTDSNLIALIDEAIINNSDVLIALQRIEGARSGVQLKKGALFPTLNANISYLQRKFGYYTMDDAGNRTTLIETGKIVPTHLPDFFAGVQTSWEIDVWGKLRNKKKAAFARYLSSIEGKNMVTTNLVSDVSNSYYELLSLDVKLDIIRETIKLRASALELIKIQKEAALANEIAVKQFEAQYFNSKAKEYKILQEITEYENRLNFLLGRYPQTIIRNKNNFKNELPFKINVGVPSDLLKYRPDIRNAELEMIAAKADVKAARAAFYPSLNITGSMGFQGYKAALLFTNPQSIAYSALGNLLAPLINRSAIKSEFASANAKQIETFYNYQKAILNGYVEVYNGVVKIKNLEKIEEFKNKEVIALSQSAEASTELYKNGRASYLEVLIIDNGTLAAKFELIDTKRQQYRSIIDLYKAIGGGWK